MGSWPAPSRKDHQQFCETEGWEEVRRATGGPVSHHLTYRLALPDGSTLRTRISRPPNRETYGTNLWAAILRDQLQVDEASFWACVQHGELPDRGAAQLPDEALPADLVHLLRTSLHLADSEIVQLSKTEALERLQQHWSGDS